MLKREIKATLQFLLFFLIFVTVLPKMLHVLFQGFDYFEYFMLIYQLAMVVYAMFAGLSLFFTERRQCSLEFVMSVTESRAYLTAQKIGPRLSSILILHLLYLYFSGIPTTSISLYPQAILLTVYVAVFFLSASLSLCSSNYFKAICMVLVLISAYIFVEYHLYVFSSEGNHELIPLFTGEYGKHTISRFLTINVTLIVPLIYSFIRAFVKAGAYAAISFNVNFLKQIGITLLCGVFLAILMLHVTTDRVDREYYLSSRNYLIETSYASTKVRAATEKTAARSIKKEGRKITGPITHITESSDTIFYGHYENRTFTFNRIVDNTGSEELYRTRSYNKQFSGLFLFNNVIAFIEGDENGKTLNTIDLNHRDSISKTKLSTLDFPRQTKVSIFGASKNRHGNFRLMTCDNCRGQLYTVSRVYENGKRDGLKSNWSYPIFFNGRIYDTHEGTIYSRSIRNGSWRRIRTWGKEVKLFAYGGIGDNNRRYDLGRDVTGIYGRYVKGKGKIFFHLENNRLIEDKALTSKASELPYLQFHVYNYQEGSYFIGYTGDKKMHSVREVYKIAGTGELSLLRRFPGETGEGGRYILNNGIINKSEDFIKVYAFPGLEEVRYRL
ncbi:MAG: hypothetical protein GY757_35965 [bacterium]|nr:hypothetical protein [bacterium]